MTKDEALKLALGFIERVNQDGWILADFEPQMYSTIAALKEALAQPEQDCVGWFGYDMGLRLWFETGKGEDDSIPLYKALTQRPWQGLTDEEINQIMEMGLGVRASIETALDKIEEKNNG